MKLVIVESPAKAKSLAKYLGTDYKILASYGHVRDLPSKKGSVQPENDFSFIWQIQERSQKHLQSISKSLKQANELILATDPDREGEAIAWHVLEFLKEQGALTKQAVKRVAFNAITKSAVLEALATPREINITLVDAYLARLGLDYLVGFTLSPVLWKKLPGSRSAGRVQSVALRMITEREQEIETFTKQEYWTIEGHFESIGCKFKAHLTHVYHQKLDKFSIPNQEEAEKITQDVTQDTYSVSNIEKRKTKRNPQPPFITSTLQQEAFRKLGYSAAKTMRIAQKLYEGVDLQNETVGLITYMRTDSVQVITEAIEECRTQISLLFGIDYLPNKPIIYKTKTKNAQEAHEAIRPTNISYTPESLISVLEPEQLKLYDLIWKRMAASQMASAQMNQTTLIVSSKDNSIIFRATGTQVAFDGFLKLYQEDTDDETADKNESHQFPPLKQGQALSCLAISPLQHFTQPPPRYSEASLVKKMEELGIGRPSTYARILEVLQDRNYVRYEKKQLLPEERGRIVTAFLTRFFRKYVEYSFTADMETQLDEISTGERSWKQVLSEFWSPFLQSIKSSEDLKISEVLNHIEEDLKIYLFPDTESDQKPACPSCSTGFLSLRLGKFGSFVGCSSYPSCTFTRPLDGDTPGEEENLMEEFPKFLGEDPETQLPVSLRIGPYGVYIQWGEGPKPKRVPLPKMIKSSSLTLQKALELGALPRDVGLHPETGQMIVAGIGRFGPYLKHGNQYTAVKEEDDLLKITLERAVEILTSKNNNKKKSAPKKPQKSAVKRKN